MSNITEYSNQLEWDIISTKDGQEAEIKLQNTYFQTNLSNKKLVVDYGYFGNSNLPLFIPTLLRSFPVITPTPTGETNNTLTPDSTDYFFKLTNGTTGDTFVHWIRWSPELNGYSVPIYIPPTDQEVYLNKYYWSKSTTHFAQILTDAIHTEAVARGAILANANVQVIVGPNNFSLVMSKTFFDSNWSIQFSKSLNDLFRLQSTFPDNTFQNLVFSTNPITWNNEVCLISNGTGWSTKWFPYDQLLISSTLNLLKIQNQSNLALTSNTFYTTNYKNIVLEFNIVTENPNSVYPYFVYETEASNTKFIYFENDNDFNETYDVKVYLRNIVKNIIVPYTLTKDEFINIQLRYFTKKE